MTCKLWCVNIRRILADWGEDAEERIKDESNYLLPFERERVRSFVFLEDKLRCLLSYLLQYTLISQTFHVNRSKFNILRSAEVRICLFK